MKRGSLLFLGLASPLILVSLTTDSVWGGFGYARHIPERDGLTVGNGVYDRAGIEAFTEEASDGDFDSYAFTEDRIDRLEGVPVRWLRLGCLGRRLVHTCKLA